MALDWGYGSKNGPDKWLETFPLAAGKRQSPVDIMPTLIKAFRPPKKLTWKYIPEHTIEVTNPGCGWKVNVNGKGSELSGGPLEGKYVLEQFHSHWGPTDDSGSEHTINGKSYAAELHLVHWNASKYSSFEEAAKHPDGLAVLGVFLKPGRKHNELGKIVSQLSKVQFKDQTVKLCGPVDPSNLLPENTNFWTYQGSLTTPPCSECVTWIVFKEPVEVSREQLSVFRKLKSHCDNGVCPVDEFDGFVKCNFRPTVPLGSREVRECVDSCNTENSCPIDTHRSG